MSYPLVPRSEWRAKAPRQARRNHAFSHVEVHHTVGMYGTTDEAEVMRRIQADHLGRGWNDVFYNVVVGPSGTRFVGRNDSEKGAFRLCFMGNFMVDEVTPGQLATLKHYVATFGGPAKIDTHRERAAGTSNASLCPGDKMMDIVRRIRSGAESIRNEPVAPVTYRTPAKVVEDLYVNILRRQPDEEGFNHWKSALESGNTTPFDMLLDFLGSAEFHNNSKGTSASGGVAYTKDHFFRDLELWAKRGGK